MNEEIRVGFIGIIIEQRDEVSEVNRILSQFSAMIRGRIGIPDPDNQNAVIGLVVEGTNAQVGALTGKLGNLQGITVKSALAQRKKKNGGNEK